MPTYRMTVEYDGSKFAGWQVQPRGRTVQGVLLDAVRHASGQQDVTIRGAGRTDAGVHALAQVASIECPQPLAVRAIAAALARDLPADLAVLELVPATDRFHPRHDAIRRSYRYQIARHRSAFGKRCTWWVRDPLDSRLMAAAAAHFVGRHDYAAFARRDRGQSSTVVVVEECRVVDLDTLVLVRIVASHFLWGQVRRIVGALVAVGRGSAPPDAVRDWLAGTAPPPVEAAPAAGLFLERVVFPGDDEELPPLVPVGVPWLPPPSARRRRRSGPDGSAGRAARRGRRPTG